MYMKHPNGNVKCSASYLLQSSKEKFLRDSKSGQHMEVVFGAMEMEGIQGETVERACKTELSSMAFQYLKVIHKEELD